MKSKESKKCYFCNKRVNENNSYKLVVNHDYRMCRQCIQLGYWKAAIDTIRSNDELRDKETK